MQSEKTLEDLQGEMQALHTTFQLQMEHIRNQKKQASQYDIAAVEQEIVPKQKAIKLAISVKLLTFNIKE